MIQELADNDKNTNVSGPMMQEPVDRNTTALT